MKIPKRIFFEWFTFLYRIWFTGLFTGQCASLTAVFFALVFAGCDIRQPKVEARYSSVSFKHTGTETTCLTCHSNNAPAAVNSFTHYGQQDCKLCHYAGLQWTDHAYHSRNPTPSTCTTCHEKDRKAPASGVTHGNGGDCSGCHTVAANWSVGASPHDPTPTSCISCHTADRPAPVNNQPHYDNGDCVTCHIAGGVWSNYKTFNHSSVGGSCNQCHENQRPALSNHPSQNDPAVTLKTHYVAKDCAICHKTPSTLREFTFLHTNYAGSKINFCLPCHYSKGWDKHGSTRPAYFSGDGQCFNCHNKGKTWDQ